MISNVVYDRRSIFGAPPSGIFSLQETHIYTKTNTNVYIYSLFTKLTAHLFAANRIASLDACKRAAFCRYTWFLRGCSFFFANISLIYIYMYILIYIYILFGASKPQRSFRPKRKTSIICRHRASSIYTAHMYANFAPNHMPYHPRHQSSPIHPIPAHPIPTHPTVYRVLLSYIYMGRWWWTNDQPNTKSHEHRLLVEWRSAKRRSI